MDGMSGGGQTCGFGAGCDGGRSGLSLDGLSGLDDRLCLLDSKAQGILSLGFEAWEPSLVVRSRAATRTDEGASNLGTGRRVLNELLVGDDSPLSAGRQAALNPVDGSRRRDDRCYGFALLGALVGGGPLATTGTSLSAALGWRGRVVDFGNLLRLDHTARTTGGPRPGLLLILLLLLAHRHVLFLVRGGFFNRVTCHIQIGIY